MLLAIDIGNTNTVFGLFEGPALRASLRVATREQFTADEVGIFISNLLRRSKADHKSLTKVIIASVVPPLTRAFEWAVKDDLLLSPITLTHETRLPITIDVDRPEQVGADRIANAAAAYQKYGGPVIVVDFGTATTYDVVSAEGAYIGGVITPGPETAGAQLARRTARLFEVRFERPGRVVGRDTTGALESGMFYGTLGAVDFIIDRILEETGFVEPTVIATGGLAGGIEQHSRHITGVERDLTLEGLRIIGEMN